MKAQKIRIIRWLHKATDRNSAGHWRWLMCWGVWVVMLFAVVQQALAQDTLYVNDDATGANNGSSWADAYTSLQSALAAAQSGDQIWVATGVYYPTSGTNRSATFMLKNGVVLYGGFTGTETSLDQRDWQSNLTILSGDIDQNDTNDDGNFIAETWSHIVGNNSYNVVRGSGVDSTAVLDGFIITAGRANSSAPGNLGEGGGIYLTSNAAPTLRNLTLSGSRVNRGGGGLSATAGSRPTLTDVTFTGNRADSYGGGLYVVNGAATLTRITFEGNRADNSNLSGGGLYAENSALTLIDVTFRNNTGGTGGGMFVRNGADTLVLDRVVFDSNTARGAGGAYISNSTATITNSTFISNSATGGQGGGLYVYPTSHITLTDVTFAGNQANSDGGGIFLFKDNTLVGTDLTFHDNVSGGWGGGLGGVKSNVTLTRAVFENNTANSGLGGGGLYLGDGFWGPSTATLEDMIFTGNTSTDGGGGGIEFTRGTLTIRRGLIAGNTTANDAGGGLYLSGGTSATLENVTVSGNTANSGFGGGGIYHGGSSLTLRNVTIAGNSNQYGSGQGAGLYVVSSNTPLSMVNTILADNGSEDFRRSSSSTSAMSVTYSLIENQGNAGLTHGVDGNLIGQDPLLAPLANNGGFSQTHALLDGSPAIDAGTNAEAPPTDQRGIPRPQGAYVDMGAYEAQVATGTREAETLFPKIIALHPNYPNPFNPVTHLAFKLPHSGFVELTIYDVLGREVKTLVNQQLPPGHHTVQWDGTDATGRLVGGGVYVVRLTVGQAPSQSFTATRKMILLK